MIKLRTILLYDRLYIILCFIAILYSYLMMHYYPYQSKYKETDNVIEGYIDNISVDGNKVTIMLKGKERIIVTYYFENSEEKQKFNLKLGNQIKITGEMSKPKPTTVFNLFNYEQYLYHNNIYYIFKADKIENISSKLRPQYAIKQFIINHISQMNNSSTYVKALVLGDDSGFTNEVNKSYQINGVSHLFAISGSHISFLAVILLWFLKRLKLEENKRYYVVIIFLFFYMFLTNYTGSVVRSVIFFTLLSINKMYYFNIKTINILLLTLAVLFIFKPGLLYDVGFQFSFIISLYLILFQKMIANISSYLGKTFMISFISFLASIPICINNFFQINLLSVLINIVFVPYVTLILFPLSFLSLVIPFLDGILYFFINILEAISLFLNKINVGIIVLSKPSLVIIVLYYILITVCLRGTSNKKYYYFIFLIILIIVHSNINYFNTNPYIVFLDVGQGDSIFINLPHNKGNILIDTGGQLVSDESWQKRNNTYKIGEDTIIPYLKSIGVSKLDYLILSHGDADHMGESIDIVKQFKVNKVVMNDGVVVQLESQLIKVLNELNIPYVFGKQGDNIIINNYSFDILNPKIYLNENDNSIVLHTIINNQGLLLAGDISSKTEKRLIKEYPHLKVDILKLGHHGSITSTSEELLDVYKPVYGIIQVGINNRFGHPSDIVLQRLRERNIKTFRTSLNGSIKVIIRANDVVFIPAMT